MINYFCEWWKFCSFIPFNKEYKQLFLEFFLKLFIFRGSDTPLRDVRCSPWPVNRIQYQGKTSKGQTVYRLMQLFLFLFYFFVLCFSAFYSAWWIAASRGHNPESSHLSTASDF